MAVVLHINNSSAVNARYVGWAPARCRIRQTTPATSALRVKLSNAGTVGKVVFYGTGAAPSPTSASSLTVSLPATGAWVSFWMGGQWGSPSLNDGDAAVKVQTATLTPTTLLTRRLMVRVRKNANLLTTAERDRFVNALATLNNAGAGMFQTFRDMHVAASSPEAHGAPGFLPWHRAYLLDLERELQNIDRSVALPYWRFDQPAPNLFSQDFIGQTPALGSAVSFSPTNPLQFWKVDGVSGIQRRPFFNQATGNASVINEASTLALGTNYAAFRTMEGNPHGSAHVSFSGSISSVPTAAKDPLFFLLHCNVDRLWAKWQWLGSHFDPAATASYDSANANRIGHHLPDTMWPWNGVITPPRPPTAPGGGLASSPAVSAPGASPIVSSQLDFQGRIASGARLGFDYDDVPYP